MTIQPFSGRKAVHGPVYYSTTVRIYIANKAAPKIYNKLNVQVVAKFNRSPPALAATATTQQRELVMTIKAPPNGLYRCVTILITNTQRKTGRTTTIQQPIKYCREKAQFTNVWKIVTF